MNEETKFWAESEDDDVCVEALEALESSIEWHLLNDGQDNVFDNLGSFENGNSFQNFVLNFNSAVFSPLYPIRRSSGPTLK